MWDTAWFFPTTVRRNHSRRLSGSDAPGNGAHAAGSEALHTPQAMARNAKGMVEAPGTHVRAKAGPNRNSRRTASAVGWRRQGDCIQIGWGNRVGWPQDHNGLFQIQPAIAILLIWKLFQFH